LIDSKTLQKAQTIMLDILSEVDRICKKHDIKYWLDSGTLLGSIRHNGFIPWDDDLDISMSLDDYYRFLEIVPKELPNTMRLQTSETEKDFPYDIAKIRDSRGMIIEEHEKEKKVTYDKGIFIDIIPVMYIKEGYLYKVLYRIGFLSIKLFSYKYLNMPKTRRTIIEIVDSMHKSSNAVAIRSGRFPSPLLYMEKLEVLPLKRAIFENKEFFIPKNSSRYLEALYGKGYMQLPPKDKQKTHAFKIEVF